MKELSPRARQMLDAARDMDEPADVDRARNRRALAASLAAGLATATASGGAAAVSVGKVVLVVTVAIVGLGGGVWLGAKRGREVSRVATPAMVAAPPVAPATPAPAIEPPPPAPTPAPSRRPAQPQRAHAYTPASAHGGALAEEIALLSRANAALRDRDPNAALALLSEHDRRFPASALREEVAATRLIARCQQSPGRAAAAVRTFIDKHAASPLAPRVARACGQRDQDENDP